MLRDVIGDFILLATYIACAGVFAEKMPRRKHFAARALACIAAAMAVSAALSVMIHVLSASMRDESRAPYLIWLYSAKFLAMFAMSCVMTGICYECGLWGAVFCGSAGYCIQHIAARASAFITDDLGAGYAWLGITPDSVWALSSLIGIVFSVAAVTVVKFAVADRFFERRTPIVIESKVQVIIVAAVIGVTILYNSFGLSYANSVILILREQGQDESLGYQIRTFAYIMSMIIAFLSLLLEVSLYSNKKVRGERDALMHIVEEGKVQYEREKKNIELINVKCHDLRHQLGALSGKLDAAELGEIRDAVNIYDSSFHTGNEAIDVVLSAQSLRCGKAGITLTCLLDGEGLSFMQPHEIYSLLGNAIENAVEAAEQCPPEKRVIKITEQRSGNFVNIRVENYFSGEISFEGDLPKTNKAGEGHGYGTKSMRLIAEKYGGTVTAEARGDLFSLDIFLCTP